MSQKSAQRVKELIPVSVVNLHQICHDNVLNKTRMPGLDVQEELSAPLFRTDNKWLRNDSRDHTVAFHTLLLNGNI